MSILSLIDLSALTHDFAVALASADAKRPVAINQRTKRPFQPGIEPHSEAQAVRLAVRDVNFDVPYPDKPRQKCDLLITDDGDTLFIESKLLRILGDNGKPNVHSRTARLKPGRIRLRYLSFAPLHAAVHRLPDPRRDDRHDRRYTGGTWQATLLPALAAALPL